MLFQLLIFFFRSDYDSLDPSDIVGNCALAFDTAESKLGIPALLDPEDMLTSTVPDRLSVLTYVAQFYNAFKTLEKKSPSRKNSKGEDRTVTDSDKASHSASPDKVSICTRYINM